MLVLYYPSETNIVARSIDSVKLRNTLRNWPSPGAYTLIDIE